MSKVRVGARLVHGPLARRLRAVLPNPAEHPSARTFTARLEADEIDGGWIAECVELPGCMSQGETRDEALRNLIDAITEVVSVRLSEQVSAFTNDAGTQTDVEVPLCV